MACGGSCRWARSATVGQRRPVQTILFQPVQLKKAASAINMTKGLDAAKPRQREALSPTTSALGNSEPELSPLPVSIPLRLAQPSISPRLATEARKKPGLTDWRWQKYPPGTHRLIG